MDVDDMSMVVHDINCEDRQCIDLHSPIRAIDANSDPIHDAAAQNPASVALRAPPQAEILTSALVFISC